MQDILLIDKPAGTTSFDVIRILRRKLGAQKMGHAGTLDPMATGLMIVGVGEGTKKLQEYLKLPKVYEAEVMLGLRTATGDKEGEVLEEASIIKNQFSKEDIEKILQSMVGKITLPVPRYSAIKVGGKRLYARARKGEKFEPPKKEMEVTRCELLAMRHPRESGDSLDSHSHGNDKLIIKARFDVSSGTYIRSLAEEIGKRLGVPATLWNLRRTSIGEFKIEDAEKLE